MAQRNPEMRLGMVSGKYRKKKSNNNPVRIGTFNTCEMTDPVAWRILETLLMFMKLLAVLFFSSVSFRHWMWMCIGSPFWHTFGCDE